MTLTTNKSSIVTSPKSGTKFTKSLNSDPQSKNLPRLVSKSVHFESDKSASDPNLKNHNYCSSQTSTPKSTTSSDTTKKIEFLQQNEKDDEKTLKLEPKVSENIKKVGLSGGIDKLNREEKAEEKLDEEDWDCVGSFNHVNQALGAYEEKKRMMKELNEESTQQIIRIKNNIAQRNQFAVEIEENKQMFLKRWEDQLKFTTKLLEKSFS